MVLQQWHKPIVVGVIGPPLNIDELVVVDIDRPTLQRVDRCSEIRCHRMPGGAAWHVATALSVFSEQVHVEALFPLPRCPEADLIAHDLLLMGVGMDHSRSFTGPIKTNRVIEFTDRKRSIIKSATTYPCDIRNFGFDAIRQCDLIVIAGGLDTDLLKEAIGQAERAGVPWAWNPATGHFSNLSEFAPGTTLLQLNDEEASALTDHPIDADPEILLRAVCERTGADTVVVTLGKNGAVGMTRDRDAVVQCAPDLNGHPIVGLGDKHFGIVSVAWFMSRCVTTSLAAAGHHLPHCCAALEGAACVR